MKKITTLLLMLTLSILVCNCESSDEEVLTIGEEMVTADVSYSHDLSSVHDSNPDSHFGMGDSGDDFEINMSNTHMTVQNSSNIELLPNGTTSIATSVERRGNRLYIEILDTNDEVIILNLSGDSISSTEYFLNDKNQYSSISGSLNYSSKNLNWSCHLETAKRVVDFDVD